jgi:hypothetical protein
MNYYQFWINDQRRPVWLLYDEQRTTPFLLLKQEYVKMCCPRCRRFDHDAVFEFGFDPRVDIRVKGDLFRSAEGFVCVNDRFKSVVKANSIGGLKLKRIPGTNWFVLNVAERIEADRSVYVPTKPLCAKCGRPQGVTGVFLFLRQLQIPSGRTGFFSPVFDCRGSRNRDRDIFATETAVLALKAGGISGGQFQRLLDEEEEAAFKLAEQQHRLFKRPKGSIVDL